MTTDNQSHRLVSMGYPAYLLVVDFPDTLIVRSEGQEYASPVNRLIQSPIGSTKRTTDLLRSYHTVTSDAPFSDARAALRVAST